MEQAIERLCEGASRAVADGATILVLCDRGIDETHAPIPSLLATAAVHHHLIREGSRTRCGLIVESGEPREVHHYSLLSGYGAGAVNPYVALETIQQQIDHRVLKERDQLDQALVNCFRSAAVEVVVMAGWMRIVTPVLINGYADRLVNIHPSLLPSFKGLDGIGQALAAGVKITGCSVHLVTAELDGGPILAQAAVPVDEGDDHATLSEKVHREEHRLLPEAINARIPIWRQG